MTNNDKERLVWTEDKQLIKNLQSSLAESLPRSIIVKYKGDNIIEINPSKYYLEEA